MLWGKLEWMIVQVPKQWVSDYEAEWEPGRAKFNKDRTQALVVMTKKKAGGPAM